MAEEYLHPTDVRKSHVLTRMIEKTVEENAVYDIAFAPLVQTKDRKVKLVVRQFDPAGLASFMADGGNTPIVKGGGRIQEIYMELVTIGEKHVLKPSDLLALASPDPAVSEGAARDVVKLGTQLRNRNTQRTRWMAYMAARDELTITYPDGGAITIDFDLDATDQNNDFSGSHKPTYADIGDGYAWNHTTNGSYDADIMEAVYTWTKLIEDDLGIESGQCTVHMNKATWRIVKKNAGLKGELSTQNPRIITPKMPEIVEILEIGAIRIDNSFYKLEASATTKYRYIPDGYVLITGPNKVNGVPIMEMKDGPVVMARNNQLVVANNPGAQAEIYYNMESKAENLRVQTARMPVMNYPAAFVWAQVW